MIGDLKSFLSFQRTHKNLESATLQVVEASRFELTPPSRPRVIFVVYLSKVKKRNQSAGILYAITLSLESEILYQ